MNKTVPFKREIKFDKGLNEIISISLEHDINKKESGLITGTFIISGEYKVSEISVSTEKFNYELPFSISLDSKYDATNSNVDISDFYYEITDSKTLSVNIEVIIDDLEEKEEVMPVEEREEITETKEETPITEEVSKEIEEREESTTSLFSGLEDNERYAVYKVHMVTENDTVTSIMQKYSVTKDELESYNDLTDLKLGDKLIIPANEQN